MNAWRMIRLGGFAAVTAVGSLSADWSYADNTASNLNQTGMFVWFDQAIWGAPDISSLQSQCIYSDGSYRWDANILSNASGAGFQSLLHLAQNEDETIDPRAQIMGGSVFVIAETLCSDAGEFKPWGTPDLELTLPDCYQTNTNAQANILAFKTDTYNAHAQFISKMKRSDGTQIPISLMFSGERTLRWGRWLTTHTDSDGTQFGGLTQLDQSQCADCGTAGNEPPAPCDCGDAGGGIWSRYWPHNATASTIDDYQIVINYTNRVIDFVTHCKPGLATGDYDFGPNPVIDVYLDLEMFQLSKVQPIAHSSVNGKQTYGCYLNGTESMPQHCRDHITDNTNASDPFSQVVTYWQVPASIADSFWRTLRQVRAQIDEHNNNVSDQDWADGKGVRLSMTVWAQEAYRWVSPRWAIEDNSTSSDSYNSNSSAPGYGMFKEFFGSAKINRASGSEDWSCDCCTLEGTIGSGTSTYDADVVDDFTIMNCMYKYADRVAFGTYQSTPAGLDKVNNKKYPGRYNMAVDFVGANNTTDRPIKDWYPGMGIPTTGGTQIDFTKAYAYLPQDPGTGVRDIYRFNPSAAWPPNATPGDPAPDWSWSSADDCDSYWGYWDMATIPASGNLQDLIPTRGWVPFAARFLKSMHRWKQAQPSSSTHAPKAVLTLESTALDGYNSGGGNCFLTSLANTWVWGNESNDTVPCAQWPPEYSLCPEDRVTYVVGGGPTMTANANSSLVVGNAWGLRPALRLFSKTPASDDGTGPAVLADYLDATPFAMNNFFSYYGLISPNHDSLPGYYYRNSACHPPIANFPAVTLNPYWNSTTSNDCKVYSTCNVPGDHIRPSNVATFMYNRGVRGDFDDNLRVDIEDLLLVIRYWGTVCNGPCIQDHDGDGVTDVDDMLYVVEHWTE